MLSEREVETLAIVQKMLDKLTLLYLVTVEGGRLREVTLSKGNESMALSRVGDGEMIRDRVMIRHPPPDFYR